MSRRGRNQKNKNQQNQQKQNRKNQPGKPQQPQNTPQMAHAGGDESVRSSPNIPVVSSGPKAVFQSATQPRRTIHRAASETAVSRKLAKNKTYNLVFFDTLTQAKSDLEQLRQLSSQCDQLNIVIKAEGPMDDVDLVKVGKLFCGAAWTLIHERRKADGWYDQLQE